MENIDGNKFTNIKDRILKDRNEIELHKEKTRINSFINEAEDKKSTLLIELGMLTYQKIRNGYSYDEMFENIANEIMELDKIIYNNNIELEKINRSSATNKCECGNIIKLEDKFCSVCGMSLEDLSKDETITCEFCEAEIDEDSNYCVCCGRKVKSKELREL